MGNVHNQCCEMHHLMIITLRHLLHTHRACLTCDEAAVYVCVKPLQDNRGLDYLLVHHVQARSYRFRYAYLWEVRLCMHIQCESIL